MDYTPQVERSAEATLRCMGVEAIDRRMDEIGTAARQRMSDLEKGPGLPPGGFTPIDYMTDEELEEFHLLKLSRQMYGQEERLAASRRVRERLERRRLRRLTRRARLI